MLSASPDQFTISSSLLPIMAYHKGDDLEDDFMPDETVALSEDEGFGSLVGDQDDIGKLLSADEEEKEDVESPVERTKAPSDEKKRRRREKEKERKAKKRKLNETTGSGDLTSVALRSSGMICEYLSVMQAKSFSKMSALELQDRHIPESSIVDTTAWTGSRNLDTLVDFIVQAVPLLHTRLQQRTKSSGAPTLLFLTGAALRVAEVTRVLKNKTLQGEKGAGVAKLFAKHFKLEEHVGYLKKTKIGSAVGTPGRVGKLLCDTGKWFTECLQGQLKVFRS